MNRLRSILLGLLVFIAATFFLTATVYTDWLWFRALGYERLFFTGWFYRAGVGGAFGLFTFVFLAVNVYLARRLSPNTHFISQNQQLEQFISQARQFFDKYFSLAAYLGSAVAGVLVGVSMASTWEAWLRYLSAAPTGTKDPLFGLDVSFYFFTLPVLEIVLGYLFFILAVALGLSAFVHVVRGTLNIGQGFRAVYARGVAHLAVLAGLFMVVLSANWWTAARQLVYSPRGAVYGAGYTDAHILLPAYQILFLIGLAVAVLIVVGGSLRRWSLPLAGLAILGIGAVVGTVILPALMQQYRVSPNEIAREKAYIARGIKYTRKAFGLDEVSRRPFPVSTELNNKVIEENRDTIDSLRLWDWRPLQTTYSQLQEIRLYYKFNDVDLDRYVIDGQYRQIALSARELEIDQLPESARTWVNQHLVYTHGYGVVASPVNEIASGGLPELIIKNIPPEFSTDLKLKKPEIYYGESTNDYVIVNTKTREFDYPAGDKNKYAVYKGQGGVSLENSLTKLAFAYRFGSMKLLASEALTSKSQVLFRRNIKERLATLTPFISYDADPYMVIANGKLYWMVDGYTISDRYPYSKPAARGVNYMRNSVKAVVDAYDGSVDFYIADKDDPIIKTYARAYPGIFKPLSEMDKSLLEHIRYPETLFRIQADVYTSFHMTDPQVFYNQEDLWDTPQELYEGETQPVDPYYVNMRLPGEKRTEFALIMPFTPTNKNNMISWLAARSDTPEYGRLVLYTFPKDKLVYGPLQIEARLDQDTEISQQLSLWDQGGSSVIRGNLLVVPIGETVLYVEPIYLRAEAGQLPELKRVAVGLGNKVVMERTFEQALAALMDTGSGPGVVVDDEATESDRSDRNTDQVDVEASERGDNESADDLVGKAADAFEKAERAQKDGDWAEYGRQLKTLKSALEALQ